MPIQTHSNKIFYALCILAFLLYLEWGISTSMLPIYIHELGGSPLEVGLVFSIFAGISVFSNPFWGTVSDHLEKRKIFIVSGMASLFPIFLLMSPQKEAIHLILLRGSTAIFKGAIVPTTLALVSDISPPKRVGGNMGILRSIEMTGFALGPFIGGIITDRYGFSKLWIFVAIECLAGSIIFLLFGSDPPILKRSTNRQFTEAFKKPGLFSNIFIICISSSIFLLGLSLLGPNLNVYLFHNLGFNRTTVGILSFIGTGVTILIQPIIGSYSDKHERKPFLIFSALNLALGNIILFLAMNLPLALAARILISNYDVFQLIGSAYILDIVKKSDKSAALGIFNSTGSISRSLGAIIGGYIITITNIRTLILISSIFPALSIAIIIFLLKESKETEV